MVTRVEIDALLPCKGQTAIDLHTNATFCNARMRDALAVENVGDAVQWDAKAEELTVEFDAMTEREQKLAVKMAPKTADKTPNGGGGQKANKDKFGDKAGGDKTPKRGGDNNKTVQHSNPPRGQKANRDKFGGKAGGDKTGANKTGDKTGDNKTGDKKAHEKPIANKPQNNREADAKKQAEKQKSSAKPIPAVPAFIPTPDHKFMTDRSGTVTSSPPASASRANDAAVVANDAADGANDSTASALSVGSGAPAPQTAFTTPEGFVPAGADIGGRKSGTTKSNNDGWTKPW